MSIAEKIASLGEAKNDIAAVISDKGGNVTGGFSTFSQDIENIVTSKENQLVSLVDGTIKTIETDALILRNYTFYRCEALEYIRLLNAKSIGAYVFTRCINLSALVIDTPDCTLSNVEAFNLTKIASGTGYIYVPDSAVDVYKNATNWNTYAAQIKGVSEFDSSVFEEVV